MRGRNCHDKAGIQEQARLAYGRNVTEICLLSGVNPGFTLGHVSRHDALDSMRLRPGVHIHMRSAPDEVAFAAHRGKILDP
jgi:FO synthase subunit 2